MLSRLSSAGGNFLGDTALVENLEITKRTAAEIEQKVKICYLIIYTMYCVVIILNTVCVCVQVAEAKITEKKINEARENYRPAAARASLLYFILNDLYKINPLYQFSLKVYRHCSVFNLRKLWDKIMYHYVFIGK